MKDATDSGNTPQAGLTLDEAYAQLKASRNTDSSQEQLEDGDGVDVVEDDLEDGDELDNEDIDTEDVDEDSEDSEDDDSENDDEDSEDGEGADEEEEEIFEIEIEGETVEVTAEELHKGYLRNNDYTRKRQADAKRAKELETEYAGKLQQLNTALAQNISAEETQLGQLQKQYREATDEATKRGIHYKMLQLQQNVQARNVALQKAQELQQQTANANAEAYWKEQEELLEAQYENWSEKKETFKTYLEAQGFEDLSMFGHANMASIVEKAMQFDELQQKRKSVAKKKIKRKVPKTLKPGTGEKQFSIDKDKVRKLEAKFAKTGSIKDAQALLRIKRGLE